MSKSESVKIPFVSVGDRRRHILLQCGDMVRDAYYEAAREFLASDDEIFEAWMESASRKQMMVFTGDTEKEA